MSTALVSQIQKQIAVMQNILYDLQVDLQKAESEMANDDDMDIPFSEIWDATHQPQLNADAEPFFPPQKRFKAEAEPFYPPRAEGTKLKWFSDTDPETYRVAIAKNNGILEVKVVTDGQGYCHDPATCLCKPCGEIRLSGGQLPPWLKGAPLIKTFFKDEAEWRASLPVEGTVTITAPPPSRPPRDRVLRELCMKPLEATTDALKLLELEERFPGAIMVLSTTDRQYEITYKHNPIYGNIYCENAHISAPSFDSFGSFTIGKPSLMAEWRGLYICLSHLI